MRPRKSSGASFLFKVLHSVIALALLAIVSYTPHANAWDEKTDIKESRNRLTISGDYSNFSINGLSLLGTGVRVDFAHFITQRGAVDILLTTSLAQGTSVSSTFTGFAAYYYYSPFTDCCAQNRTVQVNGMTIISEERPKQSLFQIGIGVNEYLLNGSRNVYSASGLGLSAAYTFPLWQQDVKTSLGYSQLSTNGVPITGIFLTVGLGFNL